jgi:hypothetical protein
MGRIQKHNACQISSGGGGEDTSFKTFFSKPWDQARMVDVRMGEKESLYLRRIEGEISPVQFIGIFTLMHAAVNKKLPAVECEVKA